MKHLFKIGESYFFRTVTYHYTGKITKINGRFLMLENASWIADSGRFADAIKNEEFDEVEPYDRPVILNMEMIVDVCKIKKLPEVQK